MQKRVPTRVKYYPGCFLNHWHSRLAGHNTWPPHHPYTATCIIYFSFYLFFFSFAFSWFVCECVSLSFFSFLPPGVGGGCRDYPTRRKTPESSCVVVFHTVKTIIWNRKETCPFFSFLFPYSALFSFSLLSFFLAVGSFCPFFFLLFLFLEVGWAERNGKTKDTRVKKWTSRRTLTSRLPFFLFPSCNTCTVYYRRVMYDVRALPRSTPFDIFARGVASAKRHHFGVIISYIFL